MRVDFYFIEEDTPEGKRYGAQCSACPEKFFDRMAKGKRKRVLESGVSKAMEHAEVVHHATGCNFTGMPAVAS